MRLIRNSYDWIPVAVITAGCALAFTPLFVSMSSSVAAAVLVVSFLARSVTPSHQHCHSHLPVFRSALLNGIYDLVLMIAGGYVTAVWELQHVQGHHRTYLEPALDPAHPDRHGGRGVWRRIKYVLVNDVVATFDAYRIAAASKKPRTWRRRLSFQLSLQLLVVALLLAWQPLTALVFIVGPMLMLRWLMLWFAFAQHDGVPGTTVYNSSITHFGWSNLIYLNVGHHTAHHEKPTLHWTRLPQRTLNILPRMDPSCVHLAERSGRDRRSTSAQTS